MLPLRRDWIIGLLVHEGVAHVVNRVLPSVQRLMGMSLDLLQACYVQFRKARSSG
jgi:hypothetical protein